MPFEAGAPHHAFERCAVEEFETATGPADYVLIQGGIVVGVVEAKKLTIVPQNVLCQAERYKRAIKQPSFNPGEFGGALSLPPTARSSGTTTFGMR